MSFRLAHIFWAIAVFAIGMANFGNVGLLVAIGVVLFWASIEYRRVIGALGWFIVLGILLVIVALLIPPLEMAREAARQSTCQPAQLALCLHNYANLYGALPVAQSRATATSPPKSWRVDALAMWENSILNPVIATYRANEPWDSANNLKIAQLPLDWHYVGCPSHPPDSPQEAVARYFAIVDPRTAWPPERGLALDEIKDDPDQTLLLIEAAGRNVPWSKPEDLTFNEAVAILTDESTAAATHYRPERYAYFYKNAHGRGINVAFASGRTAFLPLPITRELATALLTINGGEPIDMRELKRRASLQLDYAHCYAFAAFIALALLPLVRVLWLRQPTPPLASPDA
jgi:hypothetical protein